jgi:putative nucleotidyltransferase with HDIG domain
LPRQPDKVFKTINYAATFLLEDMAWEEHIDEIFARLGGATGTQRVSVYEDLSTSAPEVQFLQRYSWQAATDAPYKQIQGLDQIIFQRPDMSRWAHQLRRGKTILVKASQAHKPQQDILTGLGIHALLAVPIVIQEGWWGFVSFEQWGLQSGWSTNEVELLKLAARLLSQAIQRTRAAVELHNRQHYLAVLNEMTNAALLERDQNYSLDILATHLTELFRADSCYLTSWDENHKRAFPLAASGPQAGIYRDIVSEPGEKTVTSHVLHTGQALVVHELQNSPLLSTRLRTTAPPKSILGVPLISGKRKVGAAIIGFHEHHDFTPQEIALAEQIAGQLALALSKMYLLEETHRQLEVFTLLQQTSQVSHEASNENSLLEEVTRIMVEKRYPEHFGILLLKDYGQPALQRHSSYHVNGTMIPVTGLPAEMGIPELVIQRKEPILIPDTSRETSFLGDNQHHHSALCVPIKLGEHVFGVINVESSARYAFDDHDLRLLNMVSGQLAMALHKQRLLQLERQRRQEAETLSKVTATLTSSLDLEQVLDQILTQLEQVIPYDSASLLLVKRGTLTIAAIHSTHANFPSSVPPGMWKLKHIRQLIKTHKPVIIPDTAADPNWLTVEGVDYIRCWLGIPLVVKNQVIGILNIDKATPHFFQEKHANLATAFANQAAIALDNAHLYQEMEDAYLQTVLSLAKAMDVRDSYTSGHSQRLVDIADRLCQQLGCEPKQVKAIRWAAILHDIGKIGVPDEILRKPGPLSEDEWEIMRLHPVIGAEIITPVARLSHVVPVVRHHQEKYDGSGYPAGLKGDDIPLGARILAVVDAYAAITDNRVYRPARSHADAVAEIKRCSGKQFDPTIVDHFLKIIN